MVSQKVENGKIAIYNFSMLRLKKCKNRIFCRFINIEQSIFVQE